MRYLLAILTILLPVILLQAKYHPHRTAEDIARKQTEMLIRELDIQDSIIKDTLYRLHLKFARKREISNTRAEAMQYMQEANAELKLILTPAQYLQFMSQQINYSPHRHHSPYNRIAPHDNSIPPHPSHDNGEAPNMPPRPLVSQPTDHQ